MKKLNYKTMMKTIVKKRVAVSIFLAKIISIDVIG